MPESEMHSHPHNHPHTHTQSPSLLHVHGTTSNLRLAFFLNLAFTIFEIFGGIYTNSLAILSDAVHDLGDSVSLGLAWYLERYAERAGDERFSYGYRRFSLLGALINALVLLVGSMFILSRAIPRLLNPEQTDAGGMVLFAILGVLVNGWAAFRLRESKSINARLVALHLLEDVLGWFAVLVVGVVLLFADVPLLDPLLSIAISTFVLYNVYKNLRETASLFLQAVPTGVEIEQLENELRAVEGILDIHHTHIWSLDGERHVLSTHVVVDEWVEKEALRCIKADAKQVLKPYGFTHLTIEIESGLSDCAMAD